MENKYYIPKIEEFHIGFEFYVAYHAIDMSKLKTCALFVDVMLKPTEDDWHRVTLQRYHDYDYLIDMISKENIRVKYLDKSDIESLGFNYKNELLIPSENSFYKLIDDSTIYRIDTYRHILKKDNLVRIYTAKEMFDFPYQEIFRGDIKNISELKRLLTQLNINYDNKI